MMFPVDFCRLTRDAWKFTLEGYSHRHLYGNPDQPCIYCRDCDSGRVPRPMHQQIKYWNLWMLRVLHPQLVLLEADRRVRKVPVCMNEGGYIYTPVYLPLTAVICSLIWLGLAGFLMVACGVIPEDLLARLM